MAANPQLLNRELAKEVARQELGELQDIMRDMVDEGTNLVARANQTIGQAGTPTRYQLAMLLLLRHVVEQTDAADELFRSAVFAPASLQARSILEARMQMLYLAGRRSEAAANPLRPNDIDAVPRDATGAELTGAALNHVKGDRGAAYMISDLRRRRDHAAGFVTGTVEPWLQQNMGAAPPAIVTDANNQLQLQQEVAQLNAELAVPRNAAISAEYDRLRGNSPLDPSWYSLWNGPRSVWALARSTGLAAPYQLFYSPASRVMHAADIQGQMGRPTDAGRRGLAPLRETEDVRHLASTFILHVLNVYKLAIEELRPGDFAQWQQWAPKWVGVIR